MAKVKDWLMDMEHNTWVSISKGNSLKETIAYVKRNMKNVDESYVRQVYEDHVNAH